MKFKFKKLNEDWKSDVGAKIAGVDVLSELGNLSGKSQRTYDFKLLLTCLVLAKVCDISNVDTILSMFIEIANNPYYNDNELKKALRASIFGHLSHIDVGNIKPTSNGVMQKIKSLGTKLSQDSKRYHDIYFLTAYDKRIKKKENIGKIVFMYSCDIKGKIKTSTFTNKDYMFQIFDNVDNYKMTEDGFIYVFSAYTLAFNDNDNPEKYLTKVGSKKVFITKQEAKEIYEKDNTSKDAKRRNNKIIEALYDMLTKHLGEEEYEYKGNTGKLNPKADFEIKRGIIGNEIFGKNKTFNFEDSSNVKLKWEEKWGQKEYTVEEWHNFMKELSRHTSYKGYYFGIEK